MVDIVESKDLPIMPKLTCLVGPQGQGKTTCAVTISSNYPNDCTDVLLFAFDTDATVGLKARGISVPTVPLSGISDWIILEKELKDALVKTKERVAKGITKAVIVDTVSTFDKTLLTYFAPKSADNFALYNTMLVKHRWFLMEALLTLQVPIVALFHNNFKEIPVKDKDKEKAEAQRQGAGLAKDTDNFLDITGKAANLYRAQASLILPVKRTGMLQKPEFWLYPSDTSGFETKNRFHFLSEKEPADLNRLFKKIQNLGKAV